MEPKGRFRARQPRDSAPSSPPPSPLSTGSNARIQPTRPERTRPFPKPPTPKIAHIYNVRCYRDAKVEDSLGIRKRGGGESSRKTCLRKTTSKQDNKLAFERLKPIFFPFSGFHPVFDTSFSCSISHLSRRGKKERKQQQNFPISILQSHHCFSVRSLGQFPF